jgi:hypothetical protein
MAERHGAAQHPAHLPLRIRSPRKRPLRRSGIFGAAEGRHLHSKRSGGPVFESGLKGKSKSV